jgi:basic membrane lipoprotein Med (substrate-binding protein (PBP1-ABC) superfamily)
MRRIFLTVWFLFVIVATSAVSLAQTAGSKPYSVCLVTDVGVINDNGFNQASYAGMQRAAKEFDLQNRFIETQAQTDYATNINTCVKEGFTIVVTVGYALAEAMVAAAKNRPDLYFIGVDQVIDPPMSNVVGLQAREDQGGFLAGAMAALMTRSGIVAGIFGPTEPPILKFRHGFEQGVKYVNPEVRALGVYIDDYQAPDRGATAADQLIGDDADVIFGAAGPTGSGGITHAAQKGVMVIGVDVDEYYTTFAGGNTPGAENLIMSSMKRVDNGVYDLIAMVVKGEGFPKDSTYVMEVANDGIAFSEAHEANVPDEVTKKLNAILEGLRDGSIQTGVDPVTGELLAAEATPEATTNP